MIENVNTFEKITKDFKEYIWNMDTRNKNSIIKSHTKSAQPKKRILKKHDKSNKKNRWLLRTNTILHKKWKRE
jgi:hypothetical protein